MSPARPALIKKGMGKPYKWKRWLKEIQKADEEFYTDSCLKKGDEEIERDKQALEDEEAKEAEEQWKEGNEYEKGNEF